MTTLSPTPSPLTHFAATGDPDAFSTLVRTHIDLDYAAALCQVRNPALAEDVTQALAKQLPTS